MNNTIKLTVIIPFANEGSEVENTLNSIFEYSDNNVNVIVINDASDDNFDYKNLPSNYAITYIENEQRLGVAASRELGVGVCKTEYFLLLDAHMRFYNDKWIGRITEELDKDPRTLVCAQTKVLRKNGDIVIEEDSQPLVEFSAAYINYYSLFGFLEPEWVKIKKDTSIEPTVSVPCILGAAYACSKKYWQYLRGLDGLLSYGNDEVLISLKVWLEGGTCKLLKDIEIGHIYRDVPPYPHTSETRTYNRLYISYLLLPNALKKKTFAVEKFKSPENYYRSLLLFYRNFEHIVNMKSDLNSKFTKDFCFQEKFNRSKKYKDKNSIKKKERILLKQISYIIRHIDRSNGIGLLNGKMGILLLLFHYSKYSKNSLVFQITDSLLNEIINKITENISLNLADGLLGIGWGIEYLSQNKFISCNTNEVLLDFDTKLMEVSPSRMHNYDLYYGFGGIVRYLLSRLSSGNNSREDSPFSTDFLFEVYCKSKQIVENNIYNNCPETYIEYILYYENKIAIDSPSIYDISILPDWNKYSRTSRDLKLNGLIGFCLEFLSVQSTDYNF